MAIAASDLVFYGAENMPENNVENVGGAIDTTTKVVFTDISAADEVEILSSSGSDTSQTVTVTGRNAAGEIVSEVESLDGTNVQTTTTQFERILKIEMSDVAVGTVTIRKEADDVTIATLEPGIRAVRRLFYDSSADADGGSARDFYEKIFVKNNHGSLTLTNAQIKENSDPTGFITFDIGSTYNDSGLLGGRLNVVPSGLSGSFTSSDKYLPGSGLPAGSGCSIWLKMSLPAGQAPTKDTYTLQITGTTT